MTSFLSSADNKQWTIALSMQFSLAETQSDAEVILLWATSSQVQPFLNKKLNSLNIKQFMALITKQRENFIISFRQCKSTTSQQDTTSLYFGIL